MTPSIARPAATPQLLTLDVEDLTANPRNVRADLGDLTSLIESIRAQGVLQPLVVTETDTDSYLLVAGHRRLQAAIRAGLHEVPAIMRTDLDGAVDQVAAQLGENDHRVGLNAVEEATAYQMMLDEGMTVTAIGKKVGVKPAHIKLHLPAAKATTAQQDLVIAGKASLDDLVALEEFADNPAEHHQLEAHLGNHMFSWHLERARTARRHRAAEAVTAAELKEAGVKVVTLEEISEQTNKDEEAEHPGETWVEIDQPEDPTADDVYAFLEAIGDEVDINCWYRRTDPTIDPYAAGGSTPGPADTEAARLRREQREADQQARADLHTAGRLRTAHLHGRVLAAKAPDAETLLRDLAASTARPGLHTSGYCAGLLGFTPPESGDHQEWERLRDRALRTLNAAQLAAALHLMSRANINDRLRDPASWQPDAGSSWNSDKVLAWRDELVADWGYVPAPVEQQIIDAHTAGGEPGGDD